MEWEKPRIVVIEMSSGTGTSHGDLADDPRDGVQETDEYDIIAPDSTQANASAE